MITILYQSAWPIGGGTTYTAHLVHALRHTGVLHRVLRLGKRTEQRERPVGEYGFGYTLTSLEDLIWTLRVEDTVMLMTMGDPKMDENVWATLGKHSNFWCVFHDPNEFKQFSYWNYFAHDRVITIRAHNLKHMPRAVYIPHPYVRALSRVPALDTRALACSVARTMSSKNADWILEANEALPAARRVKLYGAWDRMWFHYTISKRYPHLEPHKGYARKWGEAARLCSGYQLMVDMTVFKNDGGDTQYSLLEAMDGGAVPVMSRDWCAHPGPARTLGPAVANAAGLTTLLRKPPAPDALRAWQQSNFLRLSRVHAPAIIAPQYRQALT